MDEVRKPHEEWDLSHNLVMASLLVYKLSCLYHIGHKTEGPDWRSNGPAAIYQCLLILDEQHLEL